MTTIISSGALILSFVLVMQRSSSKSVSTKILSTPNSNKLFMNGVIFFGKRLPLPVASMAFTNSKLFSFKNVLKLVDSTIFFSITLTNKTNFYHGTPPPKTFVSQAVSISMPCKSLSINCLAMVLPFSLFTIISSSAFN